MLNRNITRQKFSQRFRNIIDRYYTTLTGKSLFRDRHYILSSLTPDIVGEFFVLDYLYRLTRLSKDGWIIFFAENFAGCKDFFLRSIQNYGDDQHFGHMLVSLLEEIIKCTKNTRKHVNNDSFFEMITSILRSYYSNFKGSSDPTILDELTKLIDEYSKEYQDSYQCWAELNVLRYPEKNSGEKEKKGKALSIAIDLQGTAFKSAKSA